MKTYLIAILSVVLLVSCNTIYNHNIECNVEHSELVREISNVLVDGGAYDLQYNDLLGIMTAKLRTDGGVYTYNFRISKNKIVMNINHSNGTSFDDSNYWIFTSQKRIAQGIQNICNNKFIILKVE